MEFKKHKISTKHFSWFKKQSNFLSNVVWILSIVIILFIWAILVNNLHFKSFEFVKKIVLETGRGFSEINNDLVGVDDSVNQPKIDKEKINILVVELPSEEIIEKLFPNLEKLKEINVDAVCITSKV